MNVVTVAVHRLLVLMVQIFGVNVVLYRWVVLSMQIRNSILAVYTLLVIRMQIIAPSGGGGVTGCVQTAPAGTASAWSAVNVYRLLDIGCRLLG
jgi:hypothetical protein